MSRNKKARPAKIRSLIAATGKRARGAANILNREEAARRSAELSVENQFLAPYIAQFEAAHASAANEIAKKDADIDASREKLHATHGALAELRLSAETVDRLSEPGLYFVWEERTKALEKAFGGLLMKREEDRFDKLFNPPWAQQMKRMDDLLRPFRQFEQLKKQLGASPLEKFGPFSVAEQVSKVSKAFGGETLATALAATGMGGVSKTLEALNGSVAQQFAAVFKPRNLIEDNRKQQQAILDSFKPRNPMEENRKMTQAILDSFKPRDLMAEHGTLGRQIQNLFRMDRPGEPDDNE